MHTPPRSLLPILVLAAGLLLLTGTLSMAQTGTGTLLGTVRDGQNEILSGAELTLTRIQTNEVFVALSAANGNYRLDGIPVGDYEIHVSLAGYQTEVRTGVLLQVGQTVRQDFHLLSGDSEEVRRTMAQALQLESEDAELGEVIGRQKLEDMPLNDRDFTKLATLAPGTAPASSTSTSGSAMGNIRVQGMRQRDNVTYVDGSLFPRFSNFKPSTDALQEFEVKTGLYGAEYGIRPGGQIVAVTRSGGNDYHGNLFWFHRNDNLDARNFFEHEKQEYKRNQMGATLGGPIRIPHLMDGRDRAWFFVSYQLESIRELRPLTGVVPTLEQREGRFTAPLRDPATGNLFPNNAIPPDRINPVATRLLAFYPRPNTQGALNFTSPDSFAPYDNPQFITRVDFKDSEQSRWSGRFVWNSGPYVTVRPISAFSAIQPLRAYGQSITNTRTLASGLTNVASIHWTRRPYYAAPSNPKPEASAALGIRQLQDSAVDRMGIPIVEVQGYTNLGDIQLQGDSITGNWQIKEQISFQRGDHSLKTGAEFRQHYMFINMEARSRFYFFDRYSGHALGDFLLGYPARTSLGGESYRANLHQNSLYLFLQDDWKLSPTLTLTLGLRYEGRFPWKDKRGFVSNFDPHRGAIAAPPVDLDLKAGETGRYPAGIPLVSWRWSEGFLPRSGLAWRVGSNSVVRLGYGIYANELDTGMLYRLTRTPREGAIRSTFNAPLNTPVLSLSDPFPEALSRSAVPTIFGVESPLPLSSTHVWGLSLQQKFSPLLMLEAGYLGSHTANQLDTVSLNDARPGTGNRQARRPFPGLQAVHIPMADADSRYHGMQFRLERRPGAEGLHLSGSFTWSSQINNGGGWEGSYERRYFRSRNLPLHHNRGLSELHLRRRLVITTSYEPPFGRGKPYLQTGPLGAVLGGWSMQVISSFQDGPWFTVYLPGDALDVGSEFSQWPDRIGNPNLAPDQRTPSRWFDTEAFARPDGFRYGNAGRTTVEGPGLANVDLSLRRTFRLSEGQNLELRLQMFNAANRANFVLRRKARVNQFGTTDFGALGEASPARQVQVALKYSF